MFHLSGGGLKSWSSRLEVSILYSLGRSWKVWVPSWLGVAAPGLGLWQDCFLASIWYDVGFFSFAQWIGVWYFLDFLQRKLSCVQLLIECLWEVEVRSLLHWRFEPDPETKFLMSIIRNYFSSISLWFFFRDVGYLWYLLFLCYVPHFISQKYMWDLYLNINTHLIFSRSEIKVVCFNSLSYVICFLIGCGFFFKL